MTNSRSGAWRVALLATLGVGSVASCGDGDEPGGGAELAKPARAEDELLLAHGILTPRLRAEAKLAAVEELLLPCASALAPRPFVAAA